jgi:hypothetical protein
VLDQHLLGRKLDSRSDLFEPAQVVLVHDAEYRTEGLW